MSIKIITEADDMDSISGEDIINFVDELSDKLYKLNFRKTYFDCENVAYESLDRILKGLGFKGHVVIKRMWQ